MKALTRSGLSMPFYRLWIGESVSRVGSEVTLFAMPLVAVIVLDASPLQMGVLSAAGSAAVLVFGLSAGVLADRHDRRWLMLLANFSRVPLLIAVPCLAWLGALNVAWLCGLAFAVGAFDVLFVSALAGYVPRLVQRERLVAANTRLEASAAAAGVAGPGLAGQLVQLLGAPCALLVDAASFAFSSVALLRLPPARSESETVAEEAHFAAIRAGFSCVWRHSIMRPLALASAHFNFFTAMFFALFMLYVVRTIGVSAALLGVLTMIGGAAALLGATTSSRIARIFGVGRTLVLVYAAPGLAGLLVPLAGYFDSRVTTFALIAGMQVVWALSVAINLVISESVKQALVADGMLGRVTATVRFVTWGVDPLGALAGGLLATSGLGVGGTLVLASSGVAASCLWVVVSDVPRLRTIADEPGSSDGAAVCCSPEP